MGPITLFDKSFLQALSVNESVWFDHYFYPVIAPLFYVETLADLRKKFTGGREPEREVATIAAKTPQMSGAPVYFHRKLCVEAMLGRDVPLDGRIPIAHGRVVQHKGKRASYVSQAPEYIAFQRWQDRKFYQLEYQQAQAWRDDLANVDLTPLKCAIDRAGVGKCKTLGEARDRAAGVVTALHRSTGRFNNAMNILGVRLEERDFVRRRWKRLGNPSLLKFAPYAAYVLTVELFFQFAVASHLIASTRPSHRIDIGYLHYLPFCQVFVSSDKLHRECAVHFLRSDQSFAWGPDLKRDLGAINDHFSLLPEDVRETGIHCFARHLPEIELPKMRELFERHTRSLLGRQDAPTGSERLHAEMMAEVEAIKHAPTANVEVSSMDDLDQLVIERMVDPRRGSWVVVPREMAKKG